MAKMPQPLSLVRTKVSTPPSSPLSGDKGVGVGMGVNALMDVGVVVSVGNIDVLVFSGTDEVLKASVLTITVVAVASSCEQETKQKLKSTIHSHLISHLATILFF